jgi:ribA/ribD-fused uncharacterized protein
MFENVCSNETDIDSQSYVISSLSMDERSIIACEVASSVSSNCITSSVNVELNQETPTVIHDMDISESLEMLYKDLDSLYDVSNSIVCVVENPNDDSQETVMHDSRRQELPARTCDGDKDMLDQPLVSQDQREHCDMRNETPLAAQMSNLTMQSNTNQMHEEKSGVHVDKSDKAFVLQRYFNSFQNHWSGKPEELEQYMNSTVSLVVVPSLLDQACRTKYKTHELVKVNILNVTDITEDNVITINLCGKECAALIDTGSKINVMSSEFMYSYYDDPEGASEKPDYQYALMANEEPCQILCKLKAYVKVGEKEYLTKFHVLPVEAEIVILGIPFLKQNKAILDFSTGDFHLEDPVSEKSSMQHEIENKSLQMAESEHVECDVFSIQLGENVIQPQEIIDIEFQLPESTGKNIGLSKSASQDDESQHPGNEVSLNFNYMIQNIGLVPIGNPKLLDYCQGSFASVRVVNVNENPVCLTKRCKVATIKLGRKENSKWETVQPPKCATEIERESGAKSDSPAGEVNIQSCELPHNQQVAMATTITNPDLALKDKRVFPPVILFFGQRDYRRIFTNFFYCSIKFGAQVYHSAEQAFQAEKARLFKDNKMRGAILNSPSAGECKRLGNRVKDFNPSAWAGASLAIMRDIITAKFDQNPDLFRSLMNTKGHVLVENNPLDCIWGAGEVDQNDPTNYTKYQGLNLLGILLTEYRESKLQPEFRLTPEQRYWDTSRLHDLHALRVKHCRHPYQKPDLPMELKRPFLDIQVTNPEDQCVWADGHDEVTQEAAKLVPTPRPENLEFDLRQASLTKKQEKEVLSFLREQQTVFAHSVYDLGTCNVLKYAIRLKPGTQPISMKAYTLGVFQKPIVLQQLAVWYRCGIIKPGIDSPWGFPSFLVYAKNKPEASARCVVDFRCLNSVTESMPYLMPTMTDIIIDLGTIVTPGMPIYVSALDCASGYLQLPVTDCTSQVLTMQTHYGKWSFTRVPFGIAPAPTLFTEVMRRIVGGLKPVRCYLDDVLCVTAGSSVKEHQALLTTVFDRFRQANMKLKLSKVQLFQDKILYLGHILSASGLSCNPFLVKAITTYPRPENVKSLRRFLGLIGFYRTYCADFARLATPLYGLLKKEADYVWEKEHQQAFEALIETIVTAPVLAIPDLNGDQKFILTTDSSTISVGYSLAQYQPMVGQDSSKLSYRIIGYGGKTLTATQRKWPISQLELYAVVAGVEHFKQYLLHKRFELWTDHSALVFILSNKKNLPDNARLARWAICLQTYSFDVFHKPGASINMRVADVLSRRQYTDQTSEEPQLYGDPLTAPCYRLEDENVVTPSELPCIAVSTADDTVDLQSVCPHIASMQLAGSVPSEDQHTETGEDSEAGTLVPPEHVSTEQPEIIYDLENVKRWQREEPEFKEKIDYLERGKLPEKGELTRNFWSTINSFYMENGLLWRLDVLPGRAEYHLRATTQLCLPKVYVKYMLYLLHDSDFAGHLGVGKTMARVKARFWFPKLSQEVTDYVTSCDKCTKFSASPYGPKFRARDLPKSKFNRISIDCASIKRPDTGVNARKTYENILVIIDSYSKYLVVVPLYNMETKYVVNALLQHWFLVFGCASKLSINLQHDDPSVIHSDNARNFKSRVMTELAELLHINTSFSLPHNPQGNSAAENSVRIVLSILRKMVYDYPSTFKKMLPFVTSSYNSARHTSTGLSPYEIVFNQPYMMPFDVITENFRATHDHMQPQTRETISHMEYCDALIRDNVLKAQKRFLSKANKKQRPYNFQVGQEVLRKLHVLDTTVDIRKLKPRWAGPYILTKIINDTTAILREKDRNAAPVLCHLRELKPARPRPDHLQVQVGLGPQQKGLQEQHKRRERYQRKKREKTAKPADPPPIVPVYVDLPPSEPEPHQKSQDESSETEDSSSSNDTSSSQESPVILRRSPRLNKQPEKCSQ